MKKTMVNVYQGKQPCGSFDSQAEADAYVLNRKLECRRQGVDCSVSEHAFSTKGHTVEVAEKGGDS